MKFQKTLTWTRSNKSRRKNINKQLEMESILDKIINNRKVETTRCTNARRNDPSIINVWVEGKKTE